jgi:hypothetical protein
MPPKKRAPAKKAKPTSTKPFLEPKKAAPAPVVPPPPPPAPPPEPKPERVKPEGADLIIHGGISDGKSDYCGKVDGVRIKGGVISVHNIGGGQIKAIIEVMNPQMLIDTILE